ncbi:MAG: sensor histidine kinase [Proteobacteria bacterium]|nr:sensor histidine kinase [Pseudomonadota bacterium]
MDMTLAFLKIHPDSIIGRRLRGPDANARTRFTPLYSLIWTIWLFLSPLYPQAGYARWLWPTLASFPVFLLLYLRGFTAPQRQIVPHALGVAVLGYLLIDFNPGACTYIIYACALFAFGPSAPKALALMLLALLPCLAIYGWLGAPWQFLLSIGVMALAVGGSNIAFRSTQIKSEQLQQTHEEIRRLAATAERERIGRDLHDLLGHTLSLIALKSELAGKLLARDVVAARREIADVERTAREALAQVRGAITGMRAAGLVGEAASARMILESAGVRFSSSGFDQAIPAEHEHCLALALREAATNIQRHAKAASASARMTLADQAVELSVHDDGNGVIHAHGNGLNGMRERVEALGGSLQVVGERGKGTTLVARLPLPTRVSAEVIGLPGPQRKAHA